MRVDLSNFSSLQAAGFEYRPDQAVKMDRLGNSRTLTPQSSCGDLESCDDDASSGKGRPLPPYLQNGAATLKASKVGARNPDGGHPTTSIQNSNKVPAWLGTATPVQAPAATGRLAKLRAQGEHVLTAMPQDQVSSRRSQLRRNAAQFLPPQQQNLYGAHHQSGMYSDHQMDAMQAYEKLLQEEAMEAVYWPEEVAAWSAFQQGFGYGWSVAPETSGDAAAAAIIDRPMKVTMDDLSAFEEERLPVASSARPLTLAPPPGL